MSGASPRVSVVIPVLNRRALLRRTLDALAEQTSEDFEVVVVDDGSRDGSADEAARDAEAGRRVRVLQGPGTGSMAARMHGVLASEAEFVAFTDSDCEPAPGWLAAGVAALDAGNDVVNGRTVPARPPGPLERTTASGPEGLFPTCNMFYRRAAFLRAGGFDPTVADRVGLHPGRKGRRLGMGEDTVLGWRVRRAGRWAYEPRAFVRHHVFPPDRVDTLSRAWMVTIFPALVREVPELCDGPLIRHGFQLGARSRGPLYVLALATLARRPFLAGASAGWWVRMRIEDLRVQPGSRAQKLRALPFELAVDVVSATALVVGSVRAKRIVL